MSHTALSEDTIRAFTNDKSYDRGRKYFKDGRVTNVNHNVNHSDDVFTAVIIGTECYHVSLDLSSLAVDCDCYAYDGDIWCKHIVALGLTIVQGDTASNYSQSEKRLSQSKHIARSDLALLLGKSNVTELGEIIETSADRHPDVWDVVKRVLVPKSLSTPAEIMSNVKSALAPVKRARNWDRLSEAAIDASEELEHIARSVIASEQGVRGSLSAAVWAYAQLDQIDDSDGELQSGIANLVERAVRIVNEHHEWLALLYEPLAQPTDLPVIADILEVGDDAVREDCIQRLDKHLIKRDQSLAAVPPDEALYVLLHFFAEKGDERLLVLLDENKVHANLRKNALVAYYSARQEWRLLIELLWPLRKEGSMHIAALRKALQQVGDADKLIELQLSDTLHALDPMRELAKLEYLLERYNQQQRLPEIVETLLARKSIHFLPKLQLLLRLKRYTEAAEMACTEARNAGRSTLNSWERPNADILSAFADQLVPYVPQEAIRIWRVLFAQEKSRVVTVSNYLRFQSICHKLAQSGDGRWLEPQLSEIITRYPTRKKLVAICRRFVD